MCITVCMTVKSDGFYVSAAQLNFFFQDFFPPKIVSLRNVVREFKQCLNGEKIGATFRLI